MARQLGVPLRYLRQWRFYRMLTQQQLAEQARVSHSSVSYVEGGQKHASFATIRKLADALGVTVDQLRYELPPEEQHLIAEPHEAQ